MAGINRTTGKATDLITFSRASGGTALRKISYGSELVTNGTFDTDTSGWITRTFGGASVSATVASGALTISTSVSGYAFLTQSFTTVVGKVYKVSGSIGSIVGGVFSAIRKADDEIGVTNLVTLGSGAGNVSNVFVATSTTTYIYMQVNAVGSAIFDNISVKEVLFDQPDGTLTLFNHPTNIPRIEYDAAGNVKGLLIEEARTNRFANSITFSDWGKVRSTISDNTDGVVAPDGSVAKVLKCDSTAWNTHVMQLNTTNAAANSVACASIMVKKQTTGIVSHVVLRLTDDAAGSNNVYAVAFDLSTGEVTATGTQFTVTSPFYSSEDVGNGWFRLSIGFTKNNTAVRTDLQVGLSSVGTLSGVLLPVFSGDGASGVYIYGVQLEEGSFPTSYIPTSGAPATRAADIASISVDNFGYNQKAGTVVVEAEMFNVTETNWLASLGNAISDSIQFYTSSSAVRTFIRVGGVDQSAFNSSTNVASNTEFSFAAGFKPNDIVSVTDGGAVATDTSALLPLITSDLKVGSSISGSNQLNGHIKSIAYYPRRLSNAQLQALTA